MSNLTASNKIHRIQARICHGRSSQNRGGTGTCVPTEREPKTNSRTAQCTTHDLLLHDFDSFNGSRAAERLLEGVKTLPAERSKDRVAKVHQTAKRNQNAKDTTSKLNSQKSALVDRGVCFVIEVGDDMRRMRCDLILVVKE